MTNAQELLDEILETKAELDKQRERKYRDIEATLWGISIFLFFLSVVSNEIGLATVRDISFGVAIEVIGALATFKLIERVWNDHETSRNLHLDLINRISAIAATGSRIEATRQTAKQEMDLISKMRDDFVASGKQDIEKLGELETRLEEQEKRLDLMETLDEKLFSDFYEAKVFIQLHMPEVYKRHFKH